MGQTESASQPRRVDPRWARVTLEQLRDEEFLSKQLRRQETIAGARQAAAASGAASRRQRTRVGLFVDATARGSGGGSGGRPLWTALLKPKDGAKTADGEADDTAADSSELIVNGRTLTADQRAKAEQAKEDELLHALVLLGKLPHEKRTAYLLCHLQEQLARYCVVPDPVAEVVALRKQILRDVYEAVHVQHQHFQVVAHAFRGVVEVLQNAVSATGEGRTHGDGSVIGAGSLKIASTSDKTSNETNLAAQFVLELIGGLLETTPSSVEGLPVSAKRTLLRDIAVLVETLPALSLVCRDPSNGGSGDALRRLIQRLQTFLVGIASDKFVPATSREMQLHGGSGSSRVHAPASAEFDISDRTLALSCLLHLAVAVGSVRDVLLVVSIILGVGEGKESTDKDTNTTSVHSGVPMLETSPKEKSSHPSAMSPPKSTRMKDHIALKEYEHDVELADDERGDVSDEMANLAVEQRLRQVHKQRIDIIPKGEMIDGQPTAVDQLLSGHSKRKSTSKSVVASHTKAAIASAVVSSSGAPSLVSSTVHRSSIPQPPSATGHNFSLTSKHHPNAAKDEFNNLLLEAESGFSFDAVSSRSSELGSPSSPRHAALVAANASCPKFHPLNIGPLLKELELLKPQVPPRQASIRSIQGSSESHIPGIPLNQQDHHSDDDREIWSCGQNSYGELGHGDTNTRKSFERIEALQQKEIVQVSAGNEHTIALSADGVVWTCGYNDNGQCGLGVTTRVNHLTELQKLGENTPVAQVHAYNGCEHTILVTQDGRAASCGYNYRGQLGHGNTQSESVPKIMRSIEGKYVRLVSCSYYHTIITCDSSLSGQSIVYTFGRNDYGQLGQNDTIDRKMPQSIEVLQDQHVVSVACGQYHSMVVTATGKLFAFGKNDYGQLGVETVENQLAPVHVKYGLERQTCLEVRCGYYHSLVLCAGAHLFGFGRNDYGQLGLGKASNSATANIQLQQQRYAIPQLVEDLEGKEIVRFACGCYHSVVVSDNGVLYVFGRNNHGQLGTGDTNERLYPFPIDDFVGKRVAMVAAGFYHTLVLTGGKDDDQSDEKGGGAREESLDVAMAGSSELIEGSGTFKINYTTLLASSVVKELCQPNVLLPDASKRSASPVSHRHRAAQCEVSNRFINDPSCDADGDDGRTEDRLPPLSLESVSAANSDAATGVSARLTRQHDMGEVLSIKAPPSEAGNSVDIAIVLLAQLDRLSSPYILKRGSVLPTNQQLPVSFASHLLTASAEFNVGDHIDGSFEPFSIQISSSTFGYLSRLIAHLRNRRIDAFTSSIFSSFNSAAATSGRKATQSAGILQSYLVSACVRLLHVNLLQLIRSGVGSLLAAFSQVVPVDSSPYSPSSSAVMAELLSLKESMAQLRSTLFCLIEKPKQQGSGATFTHQSEPVGGASAQSGRMCSDVVDVLMLGIEIFFPCACSRVTLLMRAMDLWTIETDKKDCNCCQDVDWTILGPKKVNTKRLLIPVLLKRLADDAIISKLITFGASPSSSSSAKLHNRSLQRVVDCLLERTSSDFIRAIGDLAASQSSLDGQEQTSPHQPFAHETSTTPIFSLLNTIQKHLATWATSCSSWDRVIPMDPTQPLISRLSSLAFQAIRVGQETDKEDDLPRQWRELLEFALSVIGNACDSLLQLLPRNQMSPTLGSRHHEDAFSDPAFQDRLMSALEKSIVGQLLPSLVDGLTCFSQIPAFAVGLLPSLISLTRLLDQWNVANDVVKRAAESDFVDCLGKSIVPSTVPPGTSRHKPSGGRRQGPQPLASLSSQGEKPSLNGSSRLPISEALALPWSLLLEKQLAILCAEMAATISIGDPLVNVVTQSGDGQRAARLDSAIAKWQTSALFKGGIATDFIHESVLPDGPLQRTVPHAPRLCAGGPLSFVPTFSLVLPPRETTQDPSSGDNLPSDVLWCLTQSAIHQFTMAMTSPAREKSSTASRMARALCEWLRASYATKDAAYRMLIRQSQLQKQHQVSAEPRTSDTSIEWSEAELEDAFFAALLHHSSLKMFAFLVALRRHSSSSGGTLMPPRSLMAIWRVVADLRRRYIAKRTTIKNAVDSTGDSQQEITQLQRAIMDRSQLLTTVDVDEGKEHEFYLLDSGFIAPWDPAFSFRASSMVETSSASLRSHMSARFGESALPFLSEYPMSKWRRVRTLMHVTMRWKAAARSSQAPLPSSTEALVFVMAEVADIGSVDAIAYHLLIEPCRRLSCSTRGFEMLVELLRLPRLECIQVSLLQEVAQALSRNSLPPPEVVKQSVEPSNASFQYRELRHNAQNDLVAAVMGLLCEKASDAVFGDAEGVDRRANESVMLVLLRCLGSLHITEDQYAFINDLGVVQVLQQLLDQLHGDVKSDALPNNQNDSIRSIVANTNRVAEYGHKESALPVAVWVLLRNFVLQFAASSSDATNNATALVPTFPEGHDVFNTLLAPGEDWLKAQLASSDASAASRLISSGSSINSTVRRSFEIIVAPRRLSPLTKGLTCTYDDMTQPSTSGLLAMSPLAKPNEFSITTWIYVPVSSASESGSATSQEFAGPVDEKQIVFVRGDQREIVPYMLLARDLDNKWQLEVGVAVHAVLPGSSIASSSAPTRLLWERLNSKDGLPCGRWTHVAIVLEGPKIRLYINGVLDSQRSLSGPLAVASSSGRVDLDLCFGRQQPIIGPLPGDVNRSNDDPSLAESRLRAPLAMAFLSGLLAATASSKTLLATSPSGAKPVVRSFDGLLSHFRFHNRSLSPIHVRIVYDEKKPVKEDAMLSSGEAPDSSVPEAAEKLLQLHAVLRVMIESNEGRVHLRDPSWSAQLWRIFMQSSHNSLQLSSLRLLRHILLFLPPDAVFDAASATPTAEKYSFVHHVLYIIGSCVSTPSCTTSRLCVQYPLPVSMARRDLCGSGAQSPSELRNATAERMMQQEPRGLSTLMLANELSELLSSLVQASETSPNSWAREVWRSIEHALQDHASGADASSVIMRTGCLYVLGGATEILTAGANVELAGTRERAVMISSDDAKARTSASVIGPTSTVVQKGSNTVYVAVDEVPSSRRHTRDRSWMNRLYSECASYQRQIVSGRNSHKPQETTDRGPESGPFVRLHRDDIQTSPAVSQLALLSADRMCDGVFSSIVDQLSVMLHSIKGIAGSFEGSVATGSDELDRWLGSSLVMRAALQAASTSNGAKRMLQNVQLLEQLLEISTNDDGNPKFAVLADLDARLWVIRRRLYHVLVELAEQAEPEVVQWFSARQSATRSASDQDPSSPNLSVKQQANEAVVAPRNESSLENPATTARKMDFRLDLALESPMDELAPASQRSGGGSSADERPHELPGSGELVESDADDDENADDRDGDDEDEDDDEDDEENEDEDEADEEHRQEFVDELMMMGFPEEWCILALKQTRNDIVGASAWIVDNLDYLSRLQTSMDKQRDESTDKLAYEDEDDDLEDGGDMGEDVGAAESSDGVDNPAGSPIRSETSVSAQTVCTGTQSPPSPLRAEAASQHFINDKEMGRKIFGEMYFPFEDGGFDSNTRGQLILASRADAKHLYPGGSSTSTAENNVDETLQPQLTPEQQVKAGDTIEHFTTRVESLELTGLLDLLVELERAFIVVFARQVLATLLSRSPSGSQDDENNVKAVVLSPLFTKFLKLTLLRGEQFQVQNGDDSTSVDGVMKVTIQRLASRSGDANGTVTRVLLDFAVAELEAAAKNPAYEAYLWTQRDLRRADSAVVNEPSVELTQWLFEILLQQPNRLIASVNYVAVVFQRLRSTLRSTNLPVKHLAITTMSLVLRQLRHHVQRHQPDEVLKKFLQQIANDVEGFLHAARNRFSREQVQHRTIFSLYLQAYVEILHLLNEISSTAGTSTSPSALLPPPIATSCLASPIVTEAAPPSRPRLSFDRKKCRSTLVQIADDGLTATFSGNEMWKTVTTTESFATGVHEWHVRVEKTPSSYLFIGVATRRANLDSFLGADDQSWGFIGDKALYYQRNRLRVYGDSFGEGDVVGVHLNCELGTLAFSKNGVDLGVAFENLMDEVFPAVAFYSRHQKVSLLLPTSDGIDVTTSSSESSSSAVSSNEGTVEEALVVCEIMESMVSKKPIRQELMRSAYEMTTGWLKGTGRHIITRSGSALWVETTPQECSAFGFKAEDRVRTPRGNGRVLGVADGRLWIEVDAERGAWHVHPSRLRAMTLVVIDAASPDNGEQAEQARSVTRTATSTTEQAKTSTTLQGASDAMTEAAFASLAQDKLWSQQLDREILQVINGHCESASISPWNVSPSEAIRLVYDKANDIEQAAGVTLAFDGDARKREELERKLLARLGFLRFFNAYLSRVIGFFDLTWQYFAPETGLTPCRLLAKCRGSVFTSIKNDFFTSLMEKTANSPKKADDEYDYPEDLTQMLINRPKAATAKCHPGTTKSLLLSMFGQAFEELHFLPLRMLRMVYSHPMDDGQLRSFKVKFEGEGVDDYGGPYREFFSQFFAELQMICTGDEGQDVKETGSANTSEATSGVSFLPFFMPSPNWRNGVGSNRDKFVLNGGLLSSRLVGSARVMAETSTPATRGGWAENAEVKRQLLCEMCHFLGQMLGICLRTRVCVRLDLAVSAWKQLVGENDEDDDDAVLSSLKETDFVAHTLLKTLRGLHDEYSRCSDGTRREELEEELAAMDLSMTTYLSDGRQVELCEGGQETVVTIANVEEYLKLALEARRNETREVVNVIKQGIHSIIPVAALSLLTWQELEKRMCGVAEVDVELLKQNTEYDEDLTPKDEFIQRFWRVLSSMEEEDKRAFLRFVWARSRLPVGTAQFHQKFKIQSLASSTSSSETTPSSAASNTSADGQLPKSHTCFFALQLPRYSSDEICRKQLLYAIHNCVEMDGDFRLADTEMTGWTEINPNDQLRF